MAKAYRCGCTGQCGHSHLCGDVTPTHCGAMEGTKIVRHAEWPGYWQLAGPELAMPELYRQKVEVVRLKDVDGVAMCQRCSALTKRKKGNKK